MKCKAIYKDKQAAQTQQQGKTAAGKAAPQTGQTRTYGKNTPPKTEQPSIKEKIAAGRQEIAAQKSAPSRAAAKNKTAEIGG